MLFQVAVFIKWPSETKKRAYHFITGACDKNDALVKVATRIAKMEPLAINLVEMQADSLGETYMMPCIPNT